MCVKCKDPSTRAERETGALRVFLDSVDADRSGEISIDELAKVCDKHTQTDTWMDGWMCVCVIGLVGEGFE